MLVLGMLLRSARFCACLSDTASFSENPEADGKRFERRSLLFFPFFPFPIFPIFCSQKRRFIFEGSE